MVRRTKSIVDFEPTNAITAGVTPSFQARLSGEKQSPRYQIKRSNSIRTVRRLAGYDPDQSDILGEYIASKIINGFLNDPDKPELSPEVTLVNDPERNDFSLASRYLNDNEINKERYIGLTLGELIKARGGKRRRDNHTIVFDQEGDVNQIPIDIDFDVEIDNIEYTIKIDKTELYNALKYSVILGEHDLNPDNFYVIIDKESHKSYLGRIDLGHSFNDLIKRWGLISDHSPKIELGRGMVLDSLNRSTLNGGAKSKFVRDFGDGVTIDGDFAQALKGKDVDISKILNSCKKELEELIESNPKLSISITKSAKTLCRRMGDPIDSSKFLNLNENRFIRYFQKLFLSDEKRALYNKQVIQSLIDRCHEFVLKNQEESKSVSNLINIQASLEEFIKKGNSERDYDELASRIKEIYDNDKVYLKDKLFSDKVEWVRVSQESEAFIGSLYEYIQERCNELGKDNIAQKLRVYLEKGDVGINIMSTAKIKDHYFADKMASKSKDKHADHLR